MGAPMSDARPTAAVERRVNYGAVFERGVGSHLVRGRADTTVCGKQIDANWPLMRGIFPLTHCPDDVCQYCFQVAANSPPAVERPPEHDVRQLGAPTPNTSTNVASKKDVEAVAAVERPGVPGVRAAPEDQFEDLIDRFEKTVAAQARAIAASGDFGHHFMPDVTKARQALRSALATVTRERDEARRDLELIREHCRVVFYPSDDGVRYPIEHTMAARKDQWDRIIDRLHRLKAARLAAPSAPRVVPVEPVPYTESRFLDPLPAPPSAPAPVLTREP